MSGLSERRPLIDAAQHIVQIAAVGARVMHVVGRDDRKARLVRERAECVDEEVVVRVEMVLELDIKTVGEDLAQTRETAARRVELARACGARDGTARAAGKTRDALAGPPPEARRDA